MAEGGHLQGVISPLASGLALSTLHCTLSVCPIVKQKTCTIGRPYGKTSISGGGGSEPIPPVPQKQRQSVISSEIEFEITTRSVAKTPMDKETPPPKPSQQLLLHDLRVSGPEQSSVIPREVGAGSIQLLLLGLHEPRSA